MAALFDGRMRGVLPTRDSIAANRWLAPFAHRLLHPSLWRFNRRSVPRAVALGLFVAPVLPLVPSLAAALLALSVRANIVVAFAVTWIINPLTIPPFYIFAYRVGRMLLRLEETAPAPMMVVRPALTVSEWLSWLLARSGPAALGTIVLAALAAAIGYVVSGLIWRIRIAQKWRRRHG